VINLGDRILTTTGSPDFGCVAKYKKLIPPLVSLDSIRYGPTIEGDGNEVTSVKFGSVF